MGLNCIINDANPILVISWKYCTNKEHESLRNSIPRSCVDLEIQKKSGPDHRLKAINKNFGARSGNFEKNAVVKNQGTKQAVQRILGDCWQWEANGQCVNCSFRHDMNKRGKSSPSNPSQNSHAAE